uniref:Disintegrin and metalloproteinase domain-containing protein 10 (Trinotate prediction) n=1 Tax=Henneguya salminicola TaxID=69463 RepID=A0A6G3MJS8_HENSL
MILEKSSNVCGNGIIELGEECDSGMDKDLCCGSAISSSPCKLIKGVCSPSQGDCCSNNCKFKERGSVCMKENECNHAKKCRFEDKIIFVATQRTVKEEKYKKQEQIADVTLLFV